PPPRSAQYRCSLHVSARHGIKISRVIDLVRPRTPSHVTVIRHHLPPSTSKYIPLGIEKFHSTWSQPLNAQLVSNRPSVWLVISAMPGEVMPEVGRSRTRWPVKSTSSGHAESLNEILVLVELVTVPKPYH